MHSDPSEWEAVFGPGTGSTLEERARQSSRVFVRSLDQLAFERPGLTGSSARRLTAQEALGAYGFDKLSEVAAEGSAALARTADAAGHPLRERRIQLGLEPRTIARRAGVTEEEVVACEESRRIGLRTYERIGRALSLDERQIAVSREPVGNAEVAVRLKTIGAEFGALGPLAVSTLAEAAWVAATQLRLQKALGFRVEHHGLETSANYGSPGYPAYEWGYLLAAEARQKLGIGPDTPIPSLRELVEEKFQIPLIQCELGETIAGATIEVDAGRAIVVNTSGRNRLFFIRRATLAHELGHLLFDPAPKLERLRVDEYTEFELAVQQSADPVEQRANAFAVEFLAPGNALVQYFRATGDLAKTVAEYGLGPTATRHQLRNASQGGVVADGRSFPAQNTDEWRQLFSDWEGRESFAVDYPAIPTLRASRAGRFCALAVRAAEDGIVSWDTAAEWLESNIATVRGARDILKDLFPRVWQQS